MVTSTYYIIPKSWLRMGAVLAALLIFGATVVLSQSWVQPDGRINQVAHFGGDALYCVDRNMVATTQYSDWGEGGFRLLSMSGQELWFVPAEAIAAAVAEAKVTGGGVLVAQGSGTYGPVVIHTYVTGDGDDYFVFSGYDEYGKPNTLEFKFCIPVGPIPEEPDTEGETPLCSLEEMVAYLSNDQWDEFNACGALQCPSPFEDEQAYYDCLCEISLTICPQ